MSPTKPDETRDGVALTNLGQSIFDGADATKRDLVDYLDGVSERILPVLRDRPLSVMRVHRGEDAFMQKNVPQYTPDFVKTIELWADTSKRKVAYALCNDRPTPLWFGNQRAVEYHPALVPIGDRAHMTHLVLDLDPPEGSQFPVVVQAARLVRQALDDLGLADDDRVIAAMATAGYPTFQATWEKRAIEEQLALETAQEEEGRT